MPVINYIDQVKAEEEKKKLQAAQPAPAPVAPMQTKFDIPQGTAAELNQSLTATQAQAAAELNQSLTATQAQAAAELNTTTPPTPEPVAPPFAFPQPKVVVGQETQTQTKTEQNVYPPAYDAANQGLQKLGEDKSKNFQQQADIQKNALELENEAIKEKQRLAELNAVHTAALTQKREEEFGRIDADIKAKTDALKKFEFKDFFAERSTFAKIMMSIAVGVNSYTATQTGGRNDSLEIMQNAIAMDFNKQKATLDKMKMDYDISKGQRGITQENYERKLTDLNLAHAQSLDKAADLIKAKALDKVKKPEIQQQLEANMIALKEQSLNMQKTEAEKQKQNVVKQTTVQEKATVVGGVDTKKAKDIQDFENGSTGIKKYKESKDALNTFNNLPDEAAIINFIAVGQKQGSFGPEVMKMIKKRGLLDQAGEFIREKLVGGVDQELMEEIRKGLKKNQAQAAKDAKSDLAITNQMRRENGLPPMGIDEQPATPSKPKNKVLMEKPQK